MDDDILAGMSRVDDSILELQHDLNKILNEVDTYFPPSLDLHAIRHQAGLLLELTSSPLLKDPISDTDGTCLADDQGDVTVLNQGWLPSPRPTTDSSSNNGVSLHCAIQLRQPL